MGERVVNLHDAEARPIVVMPSGQVVTNARDVEWLADLLQTRADADRLRIRLAASAAEIDRLRRSDEMQKAEVAALRARISGSASLEAKVEALESTVRELDDQLAEARNEFARKERWAAREAAERLERLNIEHARREPPEPRRRPDIAGMVPLATLIRQFPAGSISGTAIHAKIVSGAIQTIQPGGPSTGHWVLPDAFWNVIASVAIRKGRHLIQREGRWETVPASE